MQSTEPDVLFSDEEHHLLINFIECVTTLTKWIKILAISHNLEVRLEIKNILLDTKTRLIIILGRSLFVSQQCGCLFRKNSPLREIIRRTAAAGGVYQTGIHCKTSVRRKLLFATRQRGQT